MRKHQPNMLNKVRRKQLTSLHHNSQWSDQRNKELNWLKSNCMRHGKLSFWFDKFVKIFQFCAFPNFLELISMPHNTLPHQQHRKYTFEFEKFRSWLWHCDNTHSIWLVTVRLNKRKIMQPLLRYMQQSIWKKYPKSLCATMNMPQITIIMLRMDHHRHQPLVPIKMDHQHHHNRMTTSLLAISY